MKKYDNFIDCFNILKNSDKEMAYSDDIYRMGIIGQFNLSFELAWKTLKETLLLHGVEESKTGSPREIVKQGFSVGFVQDEDIWIDMLNRRNKIIHIYDEERANETIELIYSNYIPALERFSKMLALKIKEVEN